MTLVKIYLVVLSVMVLVQFGGTEDADGNRPAVKLTCDSSGFAPVIEHKFDKDKVEWLLVKVGTGETGCTVDKEIKADDQKIDVTDLKNKEEATVIGYTDGDKGACGGEFKYSKDMTEIHYTVDVEVTIREVLRNTINRILAKYEYKLICELKKREVSLTGKEGWTIIKSDLVAEGETEIVKPDKPVPLGSNAISFKYYDKDYKNVKEGDFEIKVSDYLYMQIAKIQETSAWNFVVEKCWSTPNPDPKFKYSDIFFDKGCPIDRTVLFEILEHKYNLQTRSFIFVDESYKDEPIVFHCKLTICKGNDKSDACKQPSKSDCEKSAAGGDKGAGRKRRSVTGKPTIRTEIITSHQHIVFDTSEIHTPVCNEGYVYDRKHKGCTNEEVLWIKGVYLDIEWNPLYLNTSSETFVGFAKEKEYQLYALLQTTGRNGIIHGIKVVRATQGSVILDVQVKYDKSSSQADAFTEFEEALQTSRATATRVMNILRIRQNTSIKYVPVNMKVMEKEKEKTEKVSERASEKTTLIIVVVVSFVVAFISAIIFYKVKKLLLLRRSLSTIKNVDGSDNMAMDNKI